MAAVVAWCAGAGDSITTPGLMQAFDGTEHEAALVAALASAEDQGITEEQAATLLRDGVERWREQEEQRRIAALLSTPLDQLTTEQKDLVRRRMGTGRIPKDSAA